MLSFLLKCAGALALWAVADAWRRNVPDSGEDDSGEDDGFFPEDDNYEDYDDTPTEERDRIEQGLNDIALDWHGRSFGELDWGQKQEVLRGLQDRW